MTGYLPEELEEVGIKDMIIGEVAYTVPWAMYAFPDGRLMINGHYPFDSEPHGTCQMKIRCEGHQIVVYRNTIGDNKIIRFPSFVAWTPDDMYVDLVEE